MLSRYAIAFFSAAVLASAQPTPSAATLLEQAKAQAARDHRAIWLIFDASW